MGFVIRDICKGDWGDAAKLAAMFSTWDDVWPGGFTRGVALTPNWAMQEMERRRTLYTLVAEEGDAFIGFCAVQSQPDQSDLAYVDLLGASPDHHGKGVGKNLLLETVRRVTRDGYRQLTLHTWAGNMKAVPLYKKTGFHWVPDTSVLMRNFLPTILGTPSGRRFFANRDWYACQERDLTVAPDEAIWKGMKVYPYRFRDGDQYFRCIFDSASEGMTALETVEYSVACSIPIEEGAAGETYPIVWEFTPCDGKPLEITLLAEAEPGLELAVQEQITVAQHTTLTRSLKVLPDARPRREGENAHRVRSLLLINGAPVTLETGVKVVQPIEVEYQGQGLFCNREEKITVRLRNRLDREITGALTLDAMPNAACEPPAQTFTLPPRSWTECLIRLIVRTTGVHTTRLRCTAETTRISREIAFRAFTNSCPIANVEAVDNERAVLESPSLSVEIGMRGGRLRITPAGASESMIRQPMGEIGPPFAENRQRPLWYEVRAEQTLHPALIQTAPSYEFVGLTVERVVTLIADSVVRVDFRIVNTTEKTLPAKLRVRHSFSLSGHIVYPSASGVIREPMIGWGVFPETDYDILAQGHSLAESWIGFEDENQVCGMIWPDGAEIECGHGLKLTFDAGEIPAYGQSTFAPLYLVTGYGNWEAVRGWWRRLVQPTGTIEPTKLETHRVLAIAAQPSPALLRIGDDLLQVVMRNEREKPLTGRLTLSGGPFLEVPVCLPVESINRDKSFEAELPIVLPSTPCAAVLKCNIASIPMPQNLTLPVVYAGGAGTIQTHVEEDGQFVVDNGYFVFRIAPHFAGSITALERSGVNHILSAYPESRPFDFTNPWFGGVHLFLNWPGDSRLTRESYTGELVVRTGDRGWNWQGTLVACDVQHKELNWLRLESEFLTLPGSNLIAIRTRWINRTTAGHSIWGGAAVWCQPGGARDNVTAHWSSLGQKHQRVRGGYAMNAGSDRQAAIENSQTGDVLCLIAPGSERRIMVDDHGKEGAHLIGGGTIKLMPGEKRETLHWLVLSSASQVLDGYAALEKAATLP